MSTEEQRAKWREAQRKYYAKDPQKRRARARKSMFKSRYGVEEERRDLILKEQGGTCAVCFTADPGGAHGQWHADHCHDSGKIRGVLCAKCNMALGLLDDDPILLEQAINYLTRETTMKPKED
jgi:hypothetical protein